MRGSNEILQAAAEVHKDYSFSIWCFKLRKKLFKSVVRLWCIYWFSFYLFRLRKEMYLLAFWRRCSFCVVVMAVLVVLFTPLHIIMIVWMSAFGWSAGQIVWAIWKRAPCLAAQPEVQRWCVCVVLMSHSSKHHPGSPRDGRIRISHSIVNLNGLIHHSKVREWCEQQRKKSVRETESDAKGCFFNIKWNWILHYLTCAVSQAAPRLLMESCNRIGSVFQFFNFTAAPRC